MIERFAPCRAALADPAFLGWTAAWTLACLLVFGLVSAIIPNPVFGRQIPPEPFAIAVWLLSAPLMGVIGATYSAPARWLPGPAVARPLGGDERGTALGSLGSLAAFLAIGCPICNKIALLLLGSGGALTLWAPWQPVIGAASLVLLAGTAAWRLRLRARGGTCAR